MKYKLLALGIIVLGMVAFGTSPAAAQTAANGPYYATPSWDQKLQCDTTATCPRFIVLSNWKNEAVLDRETGLVWERSPSGDLDWYDAQTQCNSLILGNRVGWRLPTIQELLSLVDRSVSPGPTLPAGHPFSNVHSSNEYWSTNTYALNTSLAYGVDFFFGSVDNISNKSLLQYAWCVRGGQGADPQ